MEQSSLAGMAKTQCMWHSYASFQCDAPYDCSFTCPVEPRLAKAWPEYALPQACAQNSLTMRSAYKHLDSTVTGSCNTCFCMSRLPLGTMVPGLPHGIAKPKHLLSFTKRQCYTSHVYVSRQTFIIYASLLGAAAASVLSSAGFSPTRWAEKSACLGARVAPSCSKGRGDWHEAASPGVSRGLFGAGRSGVSA